MVKRQVSAFGVKRAIIETQKNLRNNENIYCLGELVHNPNVIKKLKSNGLIVKQEIKQIPIGEKAIIRAHGVPKCIYEQASKRQIELIDLTCPKVIAIHQKVEEYTSKGYTIIYIAEKGHPESIGTLGFAQDNIIIAETKEEIIQAVKQVKKANIKKVVVLSQTTFSVQKFNEYIKIIEESFMQKIDLTIIKTICNATQLRQTETLEIAKKVEMMIIIGGRKSSNTNKLYEIAKMESQNAMFVETFDDLYINYIRRFKKVGVMAGASTPPNMIQKIVEILKNTETEGYIYERSK